VAGKYRLGQMIGRGGMGVVLEATHVELGIEVAIKVMRVDFTQNTAAVERFLREARLAAKLRGEHVCRVYDVGRLEDGAPYMVMERLEGRDLARLSSKQPLAADLVAPLIVQACSALAEAHAEGMIHRDIKPANLFVVRRPDGSPCVKVLDFGVAKGIGVDLGLTDTHSNIGSPPYMSPEQLRSSRSVTAKTDIWSLGIVMYELVSGKRPFNGESPFEVAISVAGDAVPPLPPAVPRELADVIMRCLEKDPDKRYADVGALAAALKPLAPSVDTAAVSRVFETAANQPDAVATVMATVERPTTLRGASGVLEGTSARPKRYARAAFASVALLAAGFGIAVFVMRGRDESVPVEQRAAPPVAQPDAAAAVAPLPDAAVAEEPPSVDAGTQVSAPPVVKKTKPTRKQPPPKPVRPPPTQRPPVDLSKSRY